MGCLKKKKVHHISIKSVLPYDSGQNFLGWKVAQHWECCPFFFLFYFILFFITVLIFCYHLECELPTRANEVME